MNNKPQIFIISLLLLLLLAACGGSTEPAAVDEAVEDTAVSTEASESEAMEDESMDEEVMEDEHMDEEMMEDESMDEEMMEDEHMDEEMMEDEHMDEEMMEDEHMDEEMMEDESMDEEIMEDESMDEEMMENESTVAFAGPEWLTLPLSDARTGDSFTLADFAGKTVYVEPMATWCTNCRRQLNTISEGMAQLPSDVIVVGLSVEPNLPNDVLAGYADDAGYSFLFAVATPEFIEAMVGEYGRNAANPPGTPHFIVRPDGSLSQLSTGFHSIGDIVAQIESETQ